MNAPTPAFFYNDAEFRALFPAFSNTSTYPEIMLKAYFTQAGYYVANQDYGPLAWVGATLFALYLLTAHIAQLGTLVAAGQTPGVTISATIDKISVGLQQAILKNQWQYWLASTPYGQQLLAMLQAQSVGGFYAPGGIGRAGFRY